LTNHELQNNNEPITTMAEIIAAAEELVEFLMASDVGRLILAINLVNEGLREVPPTLPGITRTP
jgi:hypothetical protein